MMTQKTRKRVNLQNQQNRKNKGQNDKMQEEPEYEEKIVKKQKKNENKVKNQDQNKQSQRKTNNRKLKDKLQEKEQNKKNIQKNYDLRERNKEQQQKQNNKNNQTEKQQRKTRSQTSENKKQNENGKSRSQSKNQKGQQNQKKNENQQNQDSQFNKEELKILSQGNSASFGQQIRKKIEEIEQKRDNKLSEKERSDLEDKFRNEFQRKFVDKYKQIQEYYKNEEKDFKYGAQYVYPDLSPLEKLLYDIKIVKRKALVDANQRCRFSYTRKQSNFSLSRANFWNNYQELAKGCQVYKTPQGKEFHNWLCFQCFYVYKDSQEVINDLLLRFSADKAKLVIANVINMGNKRSMFRNEIYKEILEFLY